MNAQVIDLDSERRRRAHSGGAARSRATIAQPKRVAPSIEINALDMPTLATPRCLHQLAMMLDDDPVEIEFTPRASLIERLRFTHSADELVRIVTITLESTT